MSQNITTDSIRTLYDLGESYYHATKGVEDEEFFDLFRKHDELGLPIEGSEIDFEALGQGVLDSGLPIPGEFIDKDTYRSGEHIVYNGFTWFKDAFDDQFWKAIENYSTKQPA